MVQRVGGFRRKTRFKLKKPLKKKGKISIKRFLQVFKEGERVILKAEPGYQKAMFFPRFYGKVGIVGEKKGRCYEVKIKDGGVEKSLIVHPVHLERV